MATSIVFVNNDNYIELSALKNAITDAFINDATVEVTIKTAAGVNIGLPSGESFPKTMAYVADSDGIYRATFDKETEWVVGTKYVATITATSSGLDAEWTIDIVVKVRDT